MTKEIKLSIRDNLYEKLDEMAQEDYKTIQDLITDIITSHVSSEPSDIGDGKIFK